MQKIILKLCVRCYCTTLYIVRKASVCVNGLRRTTLTVLKYGGMGMENGELSIAMATMANL